MTARSKKVLEAALKLSAKERFEIAERLLADPSLDEEEPFEETWDAELKRRMKDDSPGIPWEVLKELR
jgi:putative addiction module component (TIGR02574 family)